jgi:hypothetical protein
MEYHHSALLTKRTDFGLAPEKSLKILSINKFMNMNMLENLGLKKLEI